MRFLVAVVHSAHKAYITYIHNEYNSIYNIIISCFQIYRRRFYGKIYLDTTQFKMMSNARCRRIFSPICAGDDVYILCDHKGREETGWHVVFITHKSVCYTVFNGGTMKWCIQLNINRLSENTSGQRTRE